MPLPRTTPAAALVLALAASPPLAAQEVTVFYSERPRVESWDWFDDSDAGRYTFLGIHHRFGAYGQSGAIGWRAEFGVPVLAFLPDDAVLPPPSGQLGQGATYFAANGDERTAIGFHPRQLYVRLGAEANRPGHSVRVGRADFSDGAEVTPAEPSLAFLKRDRMTQRLLGPFTFTHVMRSFDGVQYGYRTARTDVTVLAAAPTEGVFTVNAWAPMDYQVGYAAWTRQLAPSFGPGDVRLFGLYARDGRTDLLKTDNRPLPDREGDAEPISVGMVGAHWLQLVKAGGAVFDLLGWGTYQFGSWGVQAHRAWAASLEAGVQPGSVGGLRPWLRVGVFHGSGDDDPTDGRHGTFYQVLPTPRPYARFPFYDFQNLEEAFVQLLLRPRRTVTLRSELHLLRLASAADLWYLGGGAFENESFGFAGRPSGGERSLATVADVALQWQMFRRLGLELYFAHAWGGRVIERIYGDGATGSLGYVQLELAVP